MVWIFALLSALMGCSDHSQMTAPLKFSTSFDVNAVHFFIVAHPDDWQLFMGEYASDVILSKTNKVVIVMLDAGDEDRGTAYWQAREKGSLASIRSLFGWDFFTPNAGEISESVSLLTYNVPVVRMKNTASYFFRLPDGGLKGGGYPSGHQESLLKLWEGNIPSITSLDGVNTYSLADLQNTLRTLIETEAVGNANFSFYLLDSGTKKNFGHSDHFASAQIARAALSPLSRSRCLLHAFEDYRIRYKTPNLSPGNQGKKMRLFEAYDSAMLESGEGCSLCSPAHYEWLFRSYYLSYTCQP